MLKKNYSKSGDNCRVTFKLSSKVGAKTAVLCGDFNEWDVNTKPMKKLKDGSFSQTMTLSKGNEYNFKYLIDGTSWENDWEADKYEINVHGSEYRKGC